LNNGLGRIAKWFVRSSNHLTFHPQGQTIDACRLNDQPLRTNDQSRQ
jgi:hypothetical protein